MNEKEKMQRKLAEIELTTKDNSYCYQLSLHKIEIENDFNNKSVSLDSYKEKIRQIVLSANNLPLEKKSKATKNFLNVLAKQTNKMSVLSYVWNSMLSADGLAVRK